MRFYYLLISDAIFVGKNGGYKKEWKSKIGYLLFALFFLNVNTIMILFDLDYSLTNFDLGTKRFNQRFNAFLQTGLPILIFNYFFIFHKNRHEKIERMYPHSNKKLFATYFIVSFIFGFGTFFLQKWCRGAFVVWD